MTSPLIRIEGLYQLFGKNPQTHMHLVKAGKTKDEILAETGHTLGLKDINLEIQQGEIFVIMGLSGSGKSTLIRHFNRLIDPTEGRVIVEDEDIMELDAKSLRNFRQKKMSMVFQRFGLLPHYTVQENVAFGLRAQGVGKEEREKKAKQWLEDVGLAGYENQYPAQLSGGQQQRVGLARALCTDAEILLMDEAFSALDPLIRSEMQDQLMALQDRLHKTIVFITHDLDEALRIGDRIAILRDGELVQVGQPADILLHPADDYVEKFVRDVNRARALTVETVMKPPTHRIDAKTINDALAHMRSAKSGYAFYVNDEGYQGFVSEENLAKVAKEKGKEPLCEDYYEDSFVISPETPLEEVIPQTLDHDHPLPVVNEAGELTGELSRDDLVQVLTHTPTSDAAGNDDASEDEGTAKGTSKEPPAA
ncbi:quaternary amine ABC transporter ATP-binding protein [Saccharospirillum salsuginis]|uniref:Quaternary amine transport ATP-binding protein n=1 Tax=Saccharospirillum salsuginis TaxID=418750 RepID=A0A918KJJ5_9GAMM|nr:glycine betaine/L-proline ABC transporter ATP-binding protein [Saccharospirillum salsuginis]GGX63378.1 ABC transporter ATP-binding protein [Saccharospirillum salsuginis]